MNPFNDVAYVPPTPLIKSQSFSDIKQLQSGSGSKVMRSDKQGLWLGANRFADAPTSIDMEGNLTARSATLKSEDGETTYIDSNGLVSTNTFSVGSTTPGSDSTTSSSYTLVAGQSITFTLPRQARVLIIYSCNLLNGSAGADSVTSNVCLRVDGVNEVGSVLVGTGTPTFGGTVFVSAAASTIQTLGVGTHTLELRMKSVQPAGTTTTFVDAAVINYIVLGS